MTFEVDGVRYRIGFQHDQPRDWDAHPVNARDRYGNPRHVVLLVAENGLRQGPGGGTHLYCETCRTILSGLSPAIARRLASQPRSSEVRDGKLRILRGSPLVEAEYARNVRCIIYRRDSDTWTSCCSGTSRLNTGAGDRYAREQGRLAALRDALPKKPADDGSLVEWGEQESRRREFCRAAMEAYLERPRGAAQALKNKLREAGV
jgi:hypothetical protein